MLVQSSKSTCENNIEMNQLKYISTYKMGQIGITKLIEEPYKSSLNTENNLSTQHQQIIKIASNTNTNTNTNHTNSNTNTNTFKAMDNISNKKILNIIIVHQIIMLNIFNHLLILIIIKIERINRIKEKI